VQQYTVKVSRPQVIFAPLNVQYTLQNYPVLLHLEAYSFDKYASIKAPHRIIVKHIYDIWWVSNITWRPLIQCTMKKVHVVKMFWTVCTVDLSHQLSLLRRVYSAVQLHDSIWMFFFREHDGLIQDYLCVFSFFCTTLFRLWWVYM
jgi:hypothetical protein